MKFRKQVRDWLAENCPPEARGDGKDIAVGSGQLVDEPELLAWRRRLGEKGWIVPRWPPEFGGAGLTEQEVAVIREELAAIDARTPPLDGGARMLGPTLLELATEDQKRRHLIPIARGEVAWCQGYSEPGAGSDLASLRTLAVEAGDHFKVNGQKIWTSGAHVSDWIFLLVRTDTRVPKHEGISFLLMNLHQPGVSVRPITLIAGSSPFCEVFFDDAIADKQDLIGELNRGWSVGKRLLQHERAGHGGLGDNRPRDIVQPEGLVETAKAYLGVDDQGRLADPDMRDRIVTTRMNQMSFRLTQRRVNEEMRAGLSAGDVSSIFKLYGATLGQETMELNRLLKGTQGLGWEGEGFSEAELETTRNWLFSKAMTIYGGTNEIQMNIIAKRVLGLPD